MSAPAEAMVHFMADPLDSQEIATLRRIKSHKTIDGHQPERFRIAYLISRQCAMFDAATGNVEITPKGEYALHYFSDLHYFAD